MKRTQNGFTLIELIIALGVMAIFALLAYRGLDSVLRLHQGAYAHEQQAQAIDRFITQLEADLRQASKVAVLEPLQKSASPRLQISRRVEASSASELAAVEWVQEGTSVIRRTTLASGMQTAELLTQVSELSWLSFSVDTSSSALTWRAVSLPAIAAQATKSVDISRGFGVRFTIAGKSLEKVFLVGR